jgi:hypothetical protein
MTMWRGRRCQAALSSTVRAVGIGLFAVIVPAVPAMAGIDEGRINDPRDVGTALDLKTLTHVDDRSSIIYTAETYAPFADQSANFKWGIDRDHDENFDLIVFTEWQDAKLAGGVKDATGRLVAPATVSRPGPTLIRVSFPISALGAVPTYRYAVDSQADLDGDGPRNPGERDLAPNSGLIQHRLGAVTPASAEATETRTAGSVPGAVTPRPAPKAAPAANLPTTGPGDRALLPWAGTALMIGGVLVALGAQRNRIRRGEVMGGIR